MRTPASNFLAQVWIGSKGTVTSLHFDMAHAGKKLNFFFAHTMLRRLPRPDNDHNVFISNTPDCREKAGHVISSFTVEISLPLQGRRGAPAHISNASRQVWVVLRFYCSIVSFHNRHDDNARRPLDSAATNTGCLLEMSNVVSLFFRK